MSRSLPPEPPVLRSTYEAYFADWARSQGWDVTKRGWPDFICRRDGALMAVEVKGGNDDFSAEQVDMLDDLSTAGLPVFVYHHGLGLKRWRRRKVESVATLKAEISELYELIRKVVQIRDGMVPGIHPPKPPEWDIQAELDVVIEYCRRRHVGHDRLGTRMTTCAWIYYFYEHEGKSFEEIIKLMGFGNVVLTRNVHRKVRRAVELARLDAAA
jgi:hypothetical protein